MDSVLKKFYSSGGNGLDKFDSFFSPPDTDYTKPILSLAKADKVPMVLLQIISQKTLGSISGSPEIGVGANMRMKNFSAYNLNVSVPNTNTYNENDFQPFNNYEFSNSQTRPVPVNLYYKFQTRNFAPDVLKMQILEERIRQIKNQHNEEKAQLMGVMQQNILETNNLRSQMNKIKVSARPKEESSEDSEEYERDLRRKQIKRDLEKARNKLKSELDSSSNEDSEQDKKKHDKNATKHPEPNKPDHSHEIKQAHHQLIRKYFIQDLEDNNRVATDLKALKDEISHQLSTLLLIVDDQSHKNRASLVDVGIDFRDLRTSIWNRIEEMEHKQRLQMENFKYILEHSGSKRLKNVSRKVFEGKHKSKERTI